MDSDWVFNLNCTAKPTQTSKYFDENIIPKEFYDNVIKRNKIGLFNDIKNNPRLVIEITTFYYNTLFFYFNQYKNTKFGMPFKIKWELINDQKITMNFYELVLFYQYITIRKSFASNFGYMLSMVFNYLTLLKQALTLIKKKEDPCCYYYLAPNITNKDKFLLFIRQFIIQ